MELTPAFLLQNPELVKTVAPWCVRLDNLEMAMLLLVQPWLSAGGLRRAELERRIARFADKLPLGPVYFQRIKRTVARLEEIGALRGAGDGGQRFAATPQGFAAFVLNLQVLGSDPTLEGGEFELKQALVARCNLILDRLSDLPAEATADNADPDPFFEEVERLDVFGRRVVTPEVVTAAFDILRLIASQRELVGRLLAATRLRVDRDEAEAGALIGLDLAKLAEIGFADAATWLAETPGAAGMLRDMASGVLPRLTGEAAVLRYEHYLSYLDDLARLYAGAFKMVTLETVRGLLPRRRI
jgi:hypothetical protein